MPVVPSESSQRHAPRRGGPVRRPALAVAALSATALALAACTSSAPGRPPSSADAAQSGRSVVQVSVSACGQGWSATQAGTQHVTLHDVDTRAGEVQLVDPTTGGVYADVEPIGPGTSVPLDIALTGGRYAFRCLMEDEAVVAGPVVTLTGSVTGASTPTVPLAQADLVPATQRYQAYVSHALPGLAAQVATLVSALRANDLAAARSAWLAGHLDYERLGAAYDAFGEADAAINGLPSGLPGGVRDQGWRGFHRIEYGLWHGEPATALLPLGTGLAQAVGNLTRTFATTQIDPGQIGIRAHEITENALQVELTGRSDFGSHSTLATVGAELAGTATVLAIVRPLLQSRYAALPHLEDSLASTRALVASLPAGVVPSTLPTRSRERLDAAISDLTEELAPVATVLEPRRTS